MTRRRALALAAGREMTKSLYDEVLIRQHGGGHVVAWALSSGGYVYIPAGNGLPNFQPRKGRGDGEPLWAPPGKLGVVVRAWLRSKRAKDWLRSERHRMVIWALDRIGRPATDREVAAALGSADPNTERPYITEMVKAGILREIATTGRKVRRVAIAKQP